MSKKKNSNLRNAMKSTGPRTQRGKNNMRMNALKEGLFSKDLVIAEADRLAYEALRADLSEQFKPQTAMQVLAVNGIVSSGWRYSRAIRRETRLLEAEAVASETPLVAPEPPSKFEWYGTNRHAARRAQELAQRAKEEIRDSGRINSETEEALRLAFGDEFVATLNNWEACDYTVMQMLVSWKRKRELFGTPLPKLDAPLPNVAKDPRELMDMQTKLLQQQCDFVMGVQLILARLDERQRTTQSPDLGHRQVAATFKEFRASVAFYDHIRGSRM